MTYAIRKATQDERDRFVRATWRRSFCSPRAHRTPAIRGEYFGLRGDEGARIDAKVWLEMLGRRLEVASEVGNCVVAELAGECLGWVAWGAFDGSRLDYVYVAPRFRRKGIGLALLRYAITRGADTAPTFLTYGGELLLNAVLREQTRATDERQQGQVAVGE